MKLMAGLSLKLEIGKSCIETEQVEQWRQSGGVAEFQQ